LKVADRNQQTTERTPRNFQKHQNSYYGTKASLFIPYDQFDTMRTLFSTDCVITDRASVVENRHGVHAAIVDSRGRLLFAVGDPARITLVRSAAKPAQALAIVETGALQKFNFDDADLALMCASHSSEDRHVTRARSILSKIQCREEDLQCGGHPAVSDVVNRSWIKADFTPTAVYSNCSGKHAGMLAGTKALGADVGTYHLPTNAMQIRVREAVDEICHLEANGSLWGTDGCNLPAPAFPLHCLGRMYAVFADGASQAVSIDSETTPRTQALSRVFHAMSTYPELVAGDDRFCTVLMTAFQGLLIGKLGAAGCYGIGIKQTDRTRELGAEGGLGIAVKIEDGNIEILYSAITEILEQLQIGEPEMRQQLSRFHCPEIKNTVGIVTGKTYHAFKVRAVEDKDFA
jgi:L-asparaginase II